MVNYLDVTLNLRDGTFRPYHKPGDQMHSIHTEYNHPPNIIKHIRASIETRLSNLSSTKTIFKESATHYEKVLQQSGYNKKLTYKPTDTNHQKHSKYKRNIWFNPTFGKDVSTKICKSFLSLLDLNFPRNHIYSSIFNISKIKVSYSCMQNKTCYKQPQYESFKQYRWDWGKLQLQEQEQLPSRWKMLNPKHHLRSTDHFQPAQL